MVKNGAKIKIFEESEKSVMKLPENEHRHAEVEDTAKTMKVNSESEIKHQDELLQSSVKIEIQEDESNEMSENYITKMTTTINNNITLNSLMNIKEKIKKEEDVTSDLSSADIENELENHIEDKQSVISDTDSALSSTNTESLKSVHDSRNYIGKILWSSFKQSSWYPCILYSMDENKPNQVLIKYFNYDGFQAYLPTKNIFEFEGMPEFWHEITAVRKISRSKIKPFPKVCLRAIEEANCFRTIPITDRLKVYDKLIQLNTFHPNKEDLEKTVDELTDDENIRENLKMIIHKLNDFDRLEENKVVPKRERKQTTEMKEDEQSNRITNRRLSGRVVKRKFEPEAFEQQSRNSTDEFKPPVEKKIKVEVEETLEERFFTEIKDIHVLFKDVTKNKICSKCQSIKNEHQDEQTFRCSGKFCAGWYHESCFEIVEQRKETFRHQTGDSDDIIIDERLTKFYLCSWCHSDQKKCLACNLMIEKDDENVINCQTSDCKLSYHESCLSHLPKHRKTCPQHYCHLCKIQGTTKNYPLAKCLKCPASYHTDIYCIPAGTQILSKTQIICPRHKTEKEEKLKKKPLNIDWCSVCTKSGSLICCDGCPNAFHSECVPDKSCGSYETFLCDDCIEGRLPVYNSMVWAKVGYYRWWPALVMVPWVVPLTTLKSQKFDREFCIRFFGSSDYYFTSCERVFPYESINEDLYVGKSGNSKLDAAYNLALVEADKMAAILSDENEKKREYTKPKSYTKIVQNRPVLPVKLKKATENTVEKCECREEDPSACARDSNCINMLLNVECDKSCSGGKNCQNQKLRNRENVDIKIVKTKNRGFGAVCAKDIEPNTFIIEYVGELIDSDELNRRMKHKISHKEKEFYFLTIESDLFVDAEFYANKSRFLNHSCDPNCETRKVTVDGNTRIGIFSNKFIKAGSELTFDYKMEFVGNIKTQCYCGSANCTGLIGDAKKIEEKKEKKIILKKRRRNQKDRNEIKTIISTPIERMELELEVESTTNNPFDLMLNQI